MNKVCKINFNTPQLNKCKPEFIDLLKHMLKKEPLERFSALECLSHKVFRSESKGDI